MLSKESLKLTTIVTMLLNFLSFFVTRKTQQEKMLFSKKNVTHDMEGTLTVEKFWKHQESEGFTGQFHRLVYFLRQEYDKKEIIRVT